MPSPNAASLGKYGDIPVSYSTGIPNIGIPIHTVTEGTLSVPISLSYHAGGLKVGEPCSWVGLGWSLQAGGMISRNMRGKPDEATSGYLTSSGLKITNDGKLADSATYIKPEDVYNTQVDGEPDVFSFSFLGYSGKFYFDADKHVEVIPKQDIKVDYFLGEGFGANRLYKFQITTNDGNIYEFGNFDGSSNNDNYIEYVQTPETFINANGWYLRKITSPDGKNSITFSYEKEKFRQWSRSTPVDSPDPTATLDYQGGYSLSYSDIQSLRLSQIKTTRETVTFESGDERMDIGYTIYKDVNKVAKSLQAIRIDNGTFCKRFKLFQSYFEDNTTYKSGGVSDFRLRLDSIQETSCTNPNINAAPYVFTYQTKDGNANFLPNRYSAAIDHWGYFNDANTNPKTGFNIPFTRLVYPIPTNSQGTNVVMADVYRGTSNRESNENAMKLGTIKQIQYPTGGSTSFEFEANTYWDTEGTPQLIDESVLLSRYWDTGQCFKDDTPVPTGIATKTFSTANYGFLYNLFFTWENKKAYWWGGSCDTYSPQSEIKVYRTSDNVLIDTKTISGITIQGSRLDSLFPNIKLDVEYRFELKGQNVASRFFIQKQIIVGKDANKAVGGLRIKTITSNDGINTANNIVKTYEYTDEANTSKTSGILYNKPSYGIIVRGDIGNSLWLMKRIGTGWNCPGPILSPISNIAPVSNPRHFSIWEKLFPALTCVTDTLFLPNSYQFHHFYENSIIPLNSFEGSHLDYTRVVERLSNGSYSVFTFSSGDMQDKEDFEGFPKLPMQPRLNTGNLTNKAIYNTSNTKVSDETTSFNNTDTYTESFGDCYRVARPPSAAINITGSWGFEGHSYTIPVYLYFVKKYKIRNKAVKQMSVTSVVDGVESLTNFTYDPLNRFLFPTVVETLNSEGRTYTTKNYYSRNLPTSHPNFAIKDTFEKHFMVGIPLQTEQLINGRKVGGSVLEYKSYGYQLYPNTGWQNFLTFYPYRAFSINRDSSLKLNVTIDSFTYSTGLPSQMTKAGFSVPQRFTWDAYRRLTNKNYGTLNWGVGYYGTSNLVKYVSDENGLMTKYAYDSLWRLSITQNRFDGTVDAPTNVQATTIYDYHFQGQTTANSIDANRNFVSTSTTFINASNTTPLSTKQYMDGLGRPIEVVKELYTPTSAFHPNDFWHQKNAVAYDALGRQNKTYLPFENSSLGYQAPTNFFSVHPYILTEYEASPLSRPIKQTNVDGTTVQTSYGANAADEVRLFSVPTEGSVSSNSYYPISFLYKTTMTDENNKSTYVFKDKLGRVVLTRKLLNNKRVDTYNVYDDYGQLTAVLPPGSVDSASGNITYALIFQYKYDNKNRLIEKKVPGADPQKFFYDSRDLLVLTQDGNMAHASPAKYLATIYDDLGRVIKTGFSTSVSPTQGLDNIVTEAQLSELLTQTNYYAGKSWVRDQGAKVLKPINVSTVRDFVWSYIERRDGYTYTGNPIWTGKQHLLCPTYRYGSVQPEGPIHDDDNYGVDWNVSAYDGAQKPTLTLRYLFALGGANEVRTYQTFNYDNGQRLTDQKYMYALNGAGVSVPTFTLSNMNYNYKDQLIEKNIGLNGSNALQSVDYTYNLRGWLTNINNVNVYSVNNPIYTPQSTGSGVIQNLMISPLVKQAMMDLAAPYKSANAMEMPPIDDNNADLFSERIDYNSPDSRMNVPSQYNGNISGVTWQVAGRDKQAYGFKYDDLDRLTESNYFDLTDVNTSGQWNSTYSTDNKFKEKLTYDLRGNIETLQRNGYKIAGFTLDSFVAANYGLIDSMAYTYGDSNRLMKIIDNSLLNKGFVSVNNANDRQYSYDKNGNLTADLNKGITNIEYNYLNLPQVITFTGNRTITFVYDASGAKLRKLVNNNGVKDSFEYVNGVEYKNMLLQRIAHTEGAVTRQVYAPTGAVSYNHEYVLRDHLGNARVTFTDGVSRGDAYWDWNTWTYIDPNQGNMGYNDGVITQDDITQINHYYPFGLNMEGNWNGSFPEAKNKYQYNDKELNVDFGLNWNDYGARWYDGSSCRWLSPDPMSEKYMSWSPYNYVMNNPIKFIDPDGMQTETKVVNVADGSIIYDDGKIDGNLYLVKDEKFNGREFSNLDEVKEAYGEGLITASISTEEKFNGEHHEVKWVADKTWTLDYVKSQMSFMGLPTNRFSDINTDNGNYTFASTDKVLDKDKKFTGLELSFGAKYGLADPLVLRQTIEHEKQHTRDIINIVNGNKIDFKNKAERELPGYMAEYNRYILLHAKQNNLPTWYFPLLQAGAKKEAKILLSKPK